MEKSPKYCLSDAVLVRVRDAMNEGNKDVYLVIWKAHYLWKEWTIFLTRSHYKWYTFDDQNHTGIDDVRAQDGLEAEILYTLSPKNLW